MTHSTPPTARQVVVFTGTFLLAWWLLDTLVATPPTPVSAVASLGAAGAAVAFGQRVSGTAWADVPEALGLRRWSRPVARSVTLAGLVGGIYLAVLLLGASGLGVTLELRANWATVLIGVLVFHGLAEELVWRGYVFARLRDRCSFAAAVWWSVPLIALTHAPIVISDGWLVGLLATMTAAITCWPFAYLWEYGGRTVWGPALLHGLIGTWQLFERSYPPSFSILVLGASITVPLMVFLPALRRQRRARITGPTPPRQHARTPVHPDVPSVLTHDTNRRAS
jgi:membrane protease YdiL (CAAX protease family)